MKSKSELIDELASLCGIVLEYWDIFGNRYEASQSTKEAILRSMGFKIESNEDIAEEIKKIHLKDWMSYIEPVKVLSVNNQPFHISVYIPLEEFEEENLNINFAIVDEEGKRDEYRVSRDSLKIFDQKFINGRRYVKTELYDRKKREIGYYKLSVTINSSAYSIVVDSKIIITPDTCYIPAELLDGRKRLWGFSLNLYSIRSEYNWGCGDFRDLGKIIEWLSCLGGSFVAINPIHALQNKVPFDISPYSPISRFYRNFIYLDINDIPDVQQSAKVKSLIESEFFKRELKRLRETNLIDYEAVAILKDKILRQAFDEFYEECYLQATSRGKAFQDYLDREGELLESFSLYFVLCNKFNLSDWQQWMLEYRKISVKDLKVLVEENRKECLYYCYLQWLIDTQLEKLSSASAKNLSLGLIFDLATGSSRSGSDLWQYQDIFALDINVGAPPDDFNPKGQNWGFPPMIPQRLKETGYEYFIQMIKKNIKHANALRIDHALGLFRLFWIPKDSSPSEGAYVTYPSEDLLRIIALESVRNKILIIAEDLGTVGENVHEKLQDFNMLSYKLLYFERNYPDPSFKMPQHYWHKALTAVTTHDLPTCYGFWRERDIEIKKELGLYLDSERYFKHLNDRKRDKKLLLKALFEQGVLQGEDLFEYYLSSEMDLTLCTAIYSYLAKTPSMLLSVSLDDILGTIDQQNLPGVVEVYPCWMQKTPLNVEEIIQDERFKEFAEALKRNNR